jgi:hypothetical protein
MNYKGKGKSKAVPVVKHRAMNLNGGVALTSALGGSEASCFGSFIVGNKSTGVDWKGG